jgi:hypothetical protein
MNKRKIYSIMSDIDSAMAERVRLSNVALERDKVKCGMCDGALPLPGYEGRACPWCDVWEKAFALGQRALGERDPATGCMHGATYWMRRALSAEADNVTGEG